MNVDKATVLAILLDIFLGEYISLIRKVSTADGIEAWINITPASTPERLKKLTKAKPMIGPIITRINEKISVSFTAKTLSLDNATPRDIKTKKIVE